jgi:hypothetical protein
MPRASVRAAGPVSRAPRPRVENRSIADGSRQRRVSVVGSSVCKVGLHPRVRCHRSEVLNEYLMCVGVGLAPVEMCHCLQYLELAHRQAKEELLVSWFCRSWSRHRTPDIAETKSYLDTLYLGGADHEKMVAVESQRDGCGEQA